MIWHEGHPKEIKFANEEKGQQVIGTKCHVFLLWEGNWDLQGTTACIILNITHWVLVNSIHYSQCVYHGHYEIACWAFFAYQVLILPNYQDGKIKTGRQE